MRPLIIASLTVALHACVAHSVRAQSDELRVGTRVRVTAPGIVAGQATAIVVGRTADSLTIASERMVPLTIAVSRITAIELSRGKSRTDGALLGILWSLPVGVALGFAADGSYGDCTTCTHRDGESPFVAMLVGSAIWGAGIGAIVGRERWDRLDLGQRVTLTSRDGAARLGLRWGI